MSANAGAPDLRVWVEAARPRTLPAAVAPVIAGTATAGVFVAWRFLAALVVGVSVQVAVNYANDYFDGVKGVDTPDRIGPRRAVASGLVAPARMRRAVFAALAVAGIAGLALAVAVDWRLLAVGAVCFLAALGYSGGPRPYASAGLGEVFVFVFFGLVATIGSAYVQLAAIPVVSVPVAVAMGLLAVAILVANNLRDLPTDEAAGKRTLTVRIGDRASRALYAALVTGAYLTLPSVVRAAESLWPLIALVSLPLAVLAVLAVVRGAVGPRLIPVLAATARVQLLYAALLAAGVALA